MCRCARRRSFASALDHAGSKSGSLRRCGTADDHTVGLVGASRTCGRSFAQWLIKKMCGIAGIVTSRGPAIEADRLADMIAMLDHRGPDERGLHLEPCAGLAHARLSIIDVAGGHQPMSNDDGSLWITFNGEIFNYIELREDLVKKGYRFHT